MRAARVLGLTVVMVAGFSLRSGEIIACGKKSGDCYPHLNSSNNSRNNYNTNLRAWSKPRHDLYKFRVRQRCQAAHAQHHIACRARRR